MDERIIRYLAMTTWELPMEAVAPDHRIRRATMDDVGAILASSTFRIADMLGRWLLRQRAIQGLESES